MIASILADRARRDMIPALDAQRRSQLGQYMTPAPIGRFMSGLFGPAPARVRVLDAGAGIGALTAAVVHELCEHEHRPNAIEATVFEVDPALVPQLQKTMTSCVEDCRVAGVAFSARIIADDYLLHAAEPLLGTPSDRTEYDFAILNPPYAKINLGSMWR